MPAIRCKCGKKISYGTIPCDDEWLTISDVDYDNWHGSIDSEELYHSFTHILKCPECRRLWVFCNGFANDPTEYVPAPEDEPT